MICGSCTDYPRTQPENVTFAGANLERADLRLSSFENASSRANKSSRESCSSNNSTSSIGLFVQLTLALYPLLCSRVIDQNAPHGDRDGCDEVSATSASFRSFAAHESEIGLASQGRGWQSMALNSHRGRDRLKFHPLDSPQTTRFCDSLPRADWTHPWCRVRADFRPTDCQLQRCDRR